jgi:uncharacterized membrane protein YhhN
MSRNTWLVLFFAITFADIFAIASGNEDLRWFTKVFIAPLLIGYVIASVTLLKTRLHKWIIAALIFSWTGDIMLMLEPKASIFFMLGLISFLMAHICYIDFFHILRLNRQVKLNWVIIGAVAVYYLALIIFLFPHLGVMKIPVIIYGAVISCMLALALHMPFITFKGAGRSLMMGALLFVASDTMLAINKFYMPFEFAGIAIMSTYCFAQLLIVVGAVSYIKRSSAE